NAMPNAKPEPAMKLLSHVCAPRPRPRSRPTADMTKPAVRGVTRRFTARHTCGAMNRPRRGAGFANDRAPGQDPRARPRARALRLPAARPRIGTGGLAQAALRCAHLDLTP